MMRLIPRLGSARWERGAEVRESALRKIRQANRAVRHRELPGAESMDFRGDFRQWEHLLRIKIVHIALVIRSRMSRQRPQLETACLTEENTLSARKHHLFSVL
jgi:hypothetical protein